MNVHLAYSFVYVAAYHLQNTRVLPPSQIEKVSFKAAQPRSFSPHDVHDTLA